MRCPPCQHDNPSPARFCIECGSWLAACPACSAELPESAKFCPECGHAVGTVPVSRTPESYTPRHLVSKAGLKHAIRPRLSEAARLLAEGRAAHALVAARDIVAGASELLVFTADGRRIEGEALDALGRPEEAQPIFEEVKALAAALGAAPARWRACLALARLHRARGNGAAARDEGREALTSLETVAAGLPEGELRRGFEQSAVMCDARSRAS
jgi:Double zinc ribbon